MEGYITVERYASFKYEDRKSLFIGEAMPVSTEDEALRFLDAVRKKYPDANHHVYAYVIRDNSIMRFSDDREPQGTAGMPVLDAIRKRNCTNVAVVVTRYFGGTLLGTGGLVRAYTASAVGALESAGIICYNVFSEINITASYSDYQKFGSVLAECEFNIENTRYTDCVTVSGKILSENVASLIAKLTQVSSGRMKHEIIGEKFDFIKK